MDVWPGEELHKKLLVLMRDKRTGLSTPSPLAELHSKCPTLLGLIPAVLMPPDPTIEDRMKAAQTVLEYVAFNSADEKVRAAGDILGLTNLPLDEIKNFCKNFHGTGKRRDFSRFARGTRLMLATRHFGEGYNNVNSIKMREADWLVLFIEKLRELFQNAGGSLDKLVTGLVEQGQLAPVLRVDHARRQSYISRSDHHDEFRVLLESSDSRLILLIGQPGMGKTTLAKALANENNPHVATLLLEVRPSPGGPTINIAKLRAALEDAGIDAEGIEADQTHLLTRLLCSERAPKFVILDNLTHAAELDDLIPEDTKATIVAIAQTEKGAPAHAAIVRVGEMTSSEAEAMIGSRLDVSAADASQLARTLEGHPLVIDWACRLIERRRLSVEDFCDEFNTETAESLAKVSTRVGAQLEAMVARTLNDLRAHNSDAFDLIGLIALKDSDHYSTCFLSRCCQRWPMGMQDKGKLSLAYAQALDVLVEYSLVDDFVDRDFGSWLVIHKFTKRIVRKLMQPELARLTLRALDATLAFHEIWYEQVKSWMGTSRSLEIEKWNERKEWDEVAEACRHMDDLCHLVAEAALMRDNYEHENVVKRAKKFIAAWEKVERGAVLLCNQDRPSDLDEDAAQAAIAAAIQSHPLIADASRVTCLHAKPGTDGRRLDTWIVEFEPDMSKWV